MYMHKLLCYVLVTTTQIFRHTEMEKIKISLTVTYKKMKICYLMGVISTLHKLL